MPKKIIFNFDEIKDFIDGVEIDHYGRCGDKYYEEFRLTDNGKIQHKYYSYDLEIDESWKGMDYKGEIIDG